MNLATGIGLIICSLTFSFCNAQLVRGVLSKDVKDVSFYSFLSSINLCIFLWALTLHLK